MGARRVCDPFELELEVFVRHLMQVLGIELRFSGRAVMSLDGRSPQNHTM